MNLDISDPKSQFSNEVNRNKYNLLTITIILVSLPIIYLIYRNANKQSNSEGIDPINTVEAIFKNDSSIKNGVDLSVIYINSGNQLKADSLIRNLLKRDSSNAILYNNLGVANITLKNFDFAIASCKKAIQLDSNFQLAKNNLKWANDEKNKALNK
jgi:Flp pilus assembly protein TadD